MTRPVTRGLALFGALILLGPACLSPTQGGLADVSASEDASGEDTAAPSDTSTAWPDTAQPDAPRPDTGAPPFACACDGDEVYRHGPCVPTLDLGCGPACASDDACGDGLVCDDCAASTTCGTRDCRPACVVPNGPQALPPEPLRAEPTRVRPGGRVTISGTSFYIGALGHSVRLGDEVLVELGGPLGGASACEAIVQIPEDTASGAHALWVSQYFGGEPWVLAGVLHVGDAARVCVQPGFPCADAADCCTAPGVTLTCTSGRCRRAPAP